jgi:hypothetical protein
MEIEIAQRDWSKGSGQHAKTAVREIRWANRSLAAFLCTLLLSLTCCCCVVGFRIKFGTRFTSNPIKQCSGCSSGFQLFSTSTTTSYVVDVEEDEALTTSPLPSLPHTTPSHYEIGQNLHDLYHKGDILGVASLFCDELQIDMTIENKKNKKGVIHNSSINSINASHPLLQDSYYYNIGLQSLLRLDMNVLATEILEKGVLNCSSSSSSSNQKRHNLKADTMHIFIRDAFGRRVPDVARTYFESYLAPNLRNTMSVNIMVEGLRKAGLVEEARVYVDRITSEYNLKADSYTYASLVRMANSTREIRDIIASAQHANETSTPLMRCCVESLGKLGAPVDALDVYQSCLGASIGEDVQEARKSGDSLLAALLSYTSVTRPVCSCGGDAMGVSSGLVALTVASLLDFDSDSGSNSDNDENSQRRQGGVPDTVVQSMPWSLLPEQGTVMWGARGYNLLFTYIGSMDGSNYRFNTETEKSGAGSDSKQQARRVYERKSRRIVLLSDDETLRLRVLVRNRLRFALIRDLSGTVSQYSDNSIISNCIGRREQDGTLLLPNGRVCDALLRSYSDDVEMARAIWKCELLPLARKTETVRPSSFLEITEKCFVALMFGCGRSGRPDIGMEIARAARRSKWSREEITKLAAAYKHGCRCAKYQQERSVFSIKNIFDKSLDASLRIELGIVEGGEMGAGLPKIRILF